MTPCEGHAGLPAEFRLLLSGMLDRVEPVVERMQAQQHDAGADDAAPGSAVPPGAAAACGVCPVCAVIAAWRGERSELAAKAVDHAAVLLAVLRAALDEGAGATAAAAPGGRTAAGGPGGGTAPGAGGGGAATGPGAAGDASRRPPHQRPPGRPVQRISVRR